MEATKKGKLQVIKSNQTMKWTFHHLGNGDKSIPDIVTAPKIQIAKISHYHVHQNIIGFRWSQAYNIQLGDRISIAPVPTAFIPRVGITPNSINTMEQQNPTTI